MRDWPHSPVHLLSLSGMYMVTGATYRRDPFFASRNRLDLVQIHLFQLAEEFGSLLQAWALFPNHYHFICEFKDAKVLPAFIQRFHSQTARTVNFLDRADQRRVWFEYWDSHISFQRSYFARLRYVHENAVHHGVVRRAANYPWCSAGWLERVASPAMRKTILNFPCDSIRVRDDFDVAMDFLADT